MSAMSDAGTDWDEALKGIARPGDVLLNKYRVDRVIGYGGMGVVVQAWHLDFEEQVAIKFLLPSLGADPEAIARFKREGRLLFKIKSEHVCRVLDVGELSAGVPFMVMELLAGRDLGGVLAGREPFPIDTAVDYGLQTCQALAEAHLRDIVHRDLKPENLFASARPDGSVCIKLLDFGLSKLTTDSREGPRERNLTANAQAMGTPNYMSPEQWMSVRDVGPAADQWAVGAILFELVTGQAPFDAPQIGQICQRVLNEPAPSLQALRPEIPAGLAMVVHKSLEKNPARRYENVGLLAMALAPFGPPGATQAAERTLRMLSRPQIDDPLSFDPLASDPGLRAASDMRATTPTPLQISAPGQGYDFVPRRSDTAQSWQHAASGQSLAGSSKLALWGAGATVAAMAILVIVLLAAPDDEPEPGGSSPTPEPTEVAVAPSASDSLPEVLSAEPTATASATASASASATSSSGAAATSRPKTGKPSPKTGKPKVVRPKPPGPPKKPNDPDDPLFEHR
jgi:serine/threonine protein kinase